MTRFEKKPTPVLHTGLVITIVTIFVADALSPLGVVDWIFYVVPVVLTFLLWRPALPLVAATVISVLMVIGYFLSPPGVNHLVATVNRSLGGVVVWVIAGVGYVFIRNKLAVRKQEWLQTGQTLLSERMGGDLRLADIGDKVVRFLAEYLEAQAGAIFVEEEGSFRRVATYGVPPGAPMPERFAAGDGLLGEAVKDRRVLAVDDIPANYLTVGSALGKSPPRHLLIAPLAVEGHVNAVVELGMFHRVYESDTELLGRVSESIAVAVRSAQLRTRLQVLLEETQRQSEELQTQSEELRVNNEELEEQGRALKESHARLEQQQSELEQTNSQLEEQTQILETQKDELGKAKQAVEEQARDLALSSRYKSEFLANMSHELRTPLNSSLILAKLLVDNREGNLTPEQVKFARTIESSGNDLLSIINDVLDLSKVESGRVEVKCQPVRLADVAESLRATFRPMADQKGLRLDMRVAPGTPEMMETDAQRLEQIIRNLLSNALKFTEHGEVSLKISRAAHGRIAFTVRDTGIGIAEEQQEVIFEPFRQADGSTNRKYGGTGLGLSISREFVRLLGGEMQLVSSVGQGSTFTVLLPERYDATRVAPPVPRLARPAAAPSSPVLTPVAAAPPSPPRIADDRAQLTGSGRVILVVEDDETFAKILSDLAHEMQFQCLIATTAAETLALAAQFSPSAVLLDLGLPDSTGLSVLDRLKTDVRTRHIPVHVVSASDYTEAAYSMGAVGYMLKPVKREQLIEAFHKLENRLTQKLRRVLIVEDDAVQLDSMRHLLGSRDVEAVGARSAAECLHKLRETTFDCMVLDLSLPDASGFSLLETLSHEDAYSFPPVIVYTGRELSTEEEERLRTYSKSIIIKGAKSPERLLDEVTLFLHQIVSELPAEKQRMLEKARSRDAALEGRHVLVVEDDVRNIFALTSILEPQGINIHIARNGREALQALERAMQPGGAPMDLVLMDLMMPEMDGLTAMREIRKRPEWRTLPIIALTAKAMKSDQEESLAAGANDYMAKPLDVDKLLSLVRVWMRR